MYQLHSVIEGDEYAHLRPCLYNSDIDIFLLCFSLVQQSSLDSLLHRWLPEIQRHTTRANRFLLIGLQADLRDINQVSQAGPWIDSALGHRLARDIGACDYIECGALTTGSTSQSHYGLRSVEMVFEMAFEHVLKQSSGQLQRRSKMKRNPCRVQ